MSANDTEARPVITKYQKMIGSIVSVIFLVVTGLASIPNIAIDQTGAGTLEKYVKSTFPQGWGFFTKSGRDPIIVPYQVEEKGNVTPLSTSPVGQLKYGAGLSRLGRAQGIELGMLLKPLDGNWSKCETRDANSCLDSAGKDSVVEIKNISPLPSVCGKVIFIETEPIPFHFRNIVSYSRVGNRYVVANVSCTEKG